MEISSEIVSLLPKELAMQYRVFPKQMGMNGDLILYWDGIGDETLLADELQVMTDQSISFEELSAAEISRMLSQYHLGDLSEENSKKEVAVIAASDDFLQVLIEEARRLKSSDIHIETFEKRSRVRVRIDGMMIERYQIEKKDYPALINKIKIMANLDIAEKRLPQDGRIQFSSSRQSAFDIRVSVLPTLYGEKVVLRLLNNNSADIDVNKLGLSEPDMRNYMDGVQRPNGIILISGPTGSGKTTTLYATLKMLNKSTRNILTIEDPIEYTLEGVNQVQLRDNIGLGFAATLRTFLRQDPDVIMVGEIRDPETANMAIRAALTGHLVLSTIHTNSAWGTVSRLMDMGIPGFLVANTLNTTVAQRLLRLLCSKCKKEAAIDEWIYPRQFRPPTELSHHHVAIGCAACYFTGYSGRRAVYEVIPIDASLSQEIRNGNMAISEILEEKQNSTLSKNAFALFAQGLTSIEEIYPLLLTS